MPLFNSRCPPTGHQVQVFSAGRPRTLMIVSKVGSLPWQLLALARFTKICRLHPVEVLRDKGSGQCRLAAALGSRVATTLHFDPCEGKSRVFGTALIARGGRNGRDSDFRISEMKCDLLVR